MCKFQHGKPSRIQLIEKNSHRCRHCRCQMWCRNVKLLNQPIVFSMVCARILFLWSMVREQHTFFLISSSTSGKIISCNLHLIAKGFKSFTQWFLKVKTKIKDMILKEDPDEITISVDGKECPKCHFFTSNYIFNF